MNFLRVLLTTSAVFLITACSAVKEQARISSPLQVMEYNTIAAEYYPRPTFLKLNTMSDGKQALMVEVDSYGSTRYGLNSLIFFSEESADDYLKMIDKYLAWEEKASARGDQFEKKIGAASDGTGVLDLTFKFFSGNEKSHFLVISNCDLLCTQSSDHHYYDVKNAKELKANLLKLKNHQLSTTNIDSAYQ